MEVEGNIFNSVPTWLAGLLRLLQSVVFLPCSPVVSTASLLPQLNSIFKQAQKYRKIQISLALAYLLFVNHWSIDFPASACSHPAAQTLAWIMRRICCYCESICAENLLLCWACAKGKLWIKSGPISPDYIHWKCLKTAKWHSVKCHNTDKILLERCQVNPTAGAHNITPSFSLLYSAKWFSVQWERHLTVFTCPTHSHSLLYSLTVPTVFVNGVVPYTHTHTHTHNTRLLSGPAHNIMWCKGRKVHTVIHMRSKLFCFAAHSCTMILH